MQLGNIKTIVAEEIELTWTEKYKLINRNLEEWLGDDFLRTGVEVRVLFTDLYAYFDNMKDPWELSDLRTQSFEAAVNEMLKSIYVLLEKLEFVKEIYYPLFLGLSVKKKPKKAFREPGNITDNGFLSFSTSVLFSVLKKRENYLVCRTAEFGVLMLFLETMKNLEAVFAKQEIHNVNLKNVVEIFINKLLRPIKKEFTNDAKLKSLTVKAYPPPRKQLILSLINSSLWLMKLFLQNIRVGKIVDVQKHSDADSLYIEKIRCQFFRT
ncbi:hypothetical protein TSAR_007783 [Trichomalopsis sarcophagae]|uniref:tyrosine--tRNA ligase n=1 Tax=Trichomalopsis sarcophagae TaxID=543379 RepID=A0A232FL33_9HYME|nr:hypothetical protein TSAR_007783 [Trichomalopsis sarcophagae]